MSETSKARTIGFWVATAIILLGGLAGGIADVIPLEQQVEMITGLGYPDYLPRMLGVAKLIAVVIIGAPKLPRLKEWAYAGMAIDLIGATWSHVAVGDAIGETLTPVIVLVILLVSYFLRPTDRRLPDPT